MRASATSLAARIHRRCRLVVEGAAARPGRALLLWGAVTLLPLPGLLFLRIHTDGRALAPPSDPAVLADAAIRRRFELRDPLVIALESPSPQGIFNPATLGSVEAITAALRSRPEIGEQHVVSLATEKRDRLVPGSSASFVTFLEPFPASPADWEALRQDLEAPAASVYTGTLVSSDRRTTAVFAGLDDGPGTDRRAVWRDVECEVGRLETGEDRLRIVGAAAAEALLGDHILEDLALLLPLSIVLLAAILWLGTRRAACVLIALGKAGFCVAWTFAVLAWLGVPVYLTTAVLPVILVTLSMADEVHLLMRFQKILPEAASPRAALERTFDELAAPVVLATTTTAAGFLSFLSASIEPVRAFGLGAALGIAYCLGFSLVATPALLVLVPERWLRSPSGRTDARSGQWPLAASLRAVERPAWTLGLILLVTVAASTGLSRLVVQDSWIESFAKDSTFRQDMEAVNRSLFGTHLLHVHLPFERPDGSESLGAEPPCADPVVVARLGELESFLRRQPQVGGVLGLSTQLRALSRFWSPGEDPEEVLSQPREILRLLHRYELSPGLARRRQVVDDDFRATVVTVYLKQANYQDTRALMSAVERWHRRELAPLGAGLAYAGDVAVSQATIPAIVRTQLLSLPLALGGVFAVIAVLFGSARLALAALFPVTVGAVWLLGWLGWAGIPLGVATSMFFAILVGLGVDSHSIHFLSRYRQVRELGHERAVERTMADVGPAIAVNTLAVALGFGLLTVSSVPANARLGALVALALVLGALLTLVGLGSVLKLAHAGARPSIKLLERSQP